LGWVRFCGKSVDFRKRGNGASGYQSDNSNDIVASISTEAMLDRT
jgi:hypothetical protein